ncbi:hypothetical protein A3Q56_02821 [Intoshia linei]|uniref:Histidine--tRNA ligase, cytoplasmic n=1 Tax=Intoshia linei TaxID=1819745 RepID=A0A177B561_9BILA|nr:hypothetical protein A3Q56_02821 [Intoshia linei]
MTDLQNNQNENKSNISKMTSLNKETNVSTNCLKTPKGMRDFGPAESLIRKNVMKKIITCFERHGATTIETPVVELMGTLTEKYGEDSKLIYELKDQGGEMLALRYDLTVPFARFVATSKIQFIKRYQIGRVYRRDNPAMARGRFREFYQCDFDIAGIYNTMLPDAECLRIIHEVMSDLNLTYKIKINHRYILDKIMEFCGVPESMFRTTCSSIDKLDKMTWDEVYNEMVNEKKLNSDVAEKIKNFVYKNGKEDVIFWLENIFKDYKDTKLISTFNDMKSLIQICKDFSMDHCISIDLSLARGLDYYTGVIFEAVLVDTNGIGSIAGGGRYDNLVGMFTKKNKSVPCVGMSLGIERIFSVLHKNMKKEKKLRQCTTEVCVVSGQSNMFSNRVKIVSKLWDNGINAETPYKRNKKLLDAFQYCENEQIPLCVVVGEMEWNENSVVIRNQFTREQLTVKIDDMIDTLKNLLNKPNV